MFCAWGLFETLMSRQSSSMLVNSAANSRLVATEYTNTGVDRSNKVIVDFLEKVEKELTIPITKVSLAHELETHCFVPESLGELVRIHYGANTW
jgi:hypothetical protein